MAKRQRYKITREFLRALTANGKFQDYADENLRGFGRRLRPRDRCPTPTAGPSWTVSKAGAPSAIGRKCKRAKRENSRKEAALLDHKGDTITQRAERKMISLARHRSFFT